MISKMIKLITNGNSYHDLISIQQHVYPKQWLPASTSGGDSDGDRDGDVDGPEKHSVILYH